MKILIAVASRHGSTREIAEAIAQELRQAGHIVDLRDVRQAEDVALYDAVIIGSAIYMGNWLAAARHFVERNQAGLSAVPVWLFSSGPLDSDNPQPAGDPLHIDEIIKATNARDHRVFVGKLDKESLGLAERLIAKTVHAPEGDFRDWEAIRGWAHAIVAALPQPVAGNV